MTQDQSKKPLKKGRFAKLFNVRNVVFGVPLAVFLSLHVGDEFSKDELEGRYDHLIYHHNEFIDHRTACVPPLDPSIEPSRAVNAYFRLNRIGHNFAYAAGLEGCESTFSLCRHGTRPYNSDYISFLEEVKRLYDDGFKNNLEESDLEDEGARRYLKAARESLQRGGRYEPLRYVAFNQ